MGKRKEPEKRERDGTRFRCRAVVDRFGTKPAFRELRVPAILQRAIVDGDTGTPLTDHLWFTIGTWPAGLAAGDIFASRWCGNAKHADANAARVITPRRALGLGSKWLDKVAILAVLVKLHTERFPRSLRTAADPRLDTLAFKGWARGARLLQTQLAMTCA
jgi:hypothetical protein